MNPVFADVLAANGQYAQRFGLSGLAPTAAKGLGIVTCMDSRIEPLAMLGLRPGDAKILRNAGARVTDDVLRTLVLATHLLGVTSDHGDRRTPAARWQACGRTRSSTRSGHASRIDATSLDFGLVQDQRTTLDHDVERIRHWPFLAPRVEVAGFIYDVDTGVIDEVL